MRLTLSLVVAGLAALWWVAALATFAASLFGALLQPRIQRRRATAAETPQVSLLLPVKLVDPGFLRAQMSAFAQDLPAYEVIVAAAERDSPAVAAMRELAGQGRVSARVLEAPGIGAVSPKLDNLAAALAVAAYDVVVTKDSNISFSPDTARVMLRSLADGVGMVCAVPVAVRAKSVAGAIEAILINRDARLLLTASAFGKGFGVGKVMIFRRSDLARAGGVEAMRYTIAEDSALSKGLAAIGLRTVFAENTVDQEIGCPLARGGLRAAGALGGDPPRRGTRHLRLRARRLPAAGRLCRGARRAAGRAAGMGGFRADARRLVRDRGRGDRAETLGVASLDAARLPRPGRRAADRLGAGLVHPRGDVGRRAA